MFFARYVENNDHEGETWTFWVEVPGNIPEYGKLTQLLLTKGVWGMYELDLSAVLNEDEVDTLVNHGGQGYMDYHNKLSGKFTCPDNVDDLYKGGIKDCFEPHN